MSVLPHRHVTPQVGGRGCESAGGGTEVTPPSRSQVSGDTEIWVDSRSSILELWTLVDPRCDGSRPLLALEAGAPAARAAREDVGVVEQAIEHRGDGGGVAEQLAPVLDGAVRGDERRGALVAAHDDLEEVLGRRWRELAHAEVVDDEQRDRRDVREVVLAGAVELGVGELLERGRGPRGRGRDGPAG